MRSSILETNVVATLRLSTSESLLEFIECSPRPAKFSLQLTQINNWRQTSEKSYGGRRLLRRLPLPLPPPRRPSLQQLAQILPRVALLHPRHVLRRALGYHAAATVAAFRAQVD